jgi:hypothetical protein
MDRLLERDGLFARSLPSPFFGDRRGLLLEGVSFKAISPSNDVSGKVSASRFLDVSVRTESRLLDVGVTSDSSFLEAGDFALGDFPANAFTESRFLERGVFFGARSSAVTLMDSRFFEEGVFTVSLAEARRSSAVFFGARSSAVTLMDSRFFEGGVFTESLAEARRSVGVFFGARSFAVTLTDSRFFKGGVFKASLAEARRSSRFFFKSSSKVDCFRARRRSAARSFDLVRSSDADRSFVEDFFAFNFRELSSGGSSLRVIAPWELDRFFELLSSWVSLLEARFSFFLSKTEEADWAIFLELLWLCLEGFALNEDLCRSAISIDPEESPPPPPPPDLFSTASMSSGCSELAEESSRSCTFVDDRPIVRDEDSLDSFFDSSLMISFAASFAFALINRRTLLSIPDFFALSKGVSPFSLTAITDIGAASTSTLTTSAHWG